MIGKSVLALMRQNGLPREVAGIVSHKFVFVVSVSKKSLSQRSVTFQVNGIQTFLGRQTAVPDISRFGSEFSDGNGSNDAPSTATLCYDNMDSQEVPNNCGLARASDRRKVRRLSFILMNMCSCVLCVCTEVISYQYSLWFATRILKLLLPKWINVFLRTLLRGAGLLATNTLFVGHLLMSTEYFLFFFVIAPNK